MHTATVKTHNGGENSGEAAAQTVQKWQPGWPRGIQARNISNCYFTYLSDRSVPL